MQEVVKGANLIDIDFSKTNLKGADLNYAPLEKVEISKKTYFQDAYVDGAKFIKKNIKKDSLKAELKARGAILN